MCCHNNKPVIYYIIFSKLGSELLKILGSVTLHVFIQVENYAIEYSYNTYSTIQYIATIHLQSTIEICHAFNSYTHTHTPT